MPTLQAILLILAYTVPVLVSGALLSRGKTVTASGTFSDWVPGRAVDGSTRTDADYCNCCAATTNQYNPWYELDLGQSYTIRRIVVQGRGRTDFNQHFEGMRILLKSVHDGYDGEETSISDATQNVDYTLPTPKSSRYVSLFLYDRTRVFLICELSVYGDCQPGEYGDQCQYRCYCEGDTCTEDGYCPSGICQPGYWGQYCHIPCTAGTYGSGCTEQCGACLNAVCDTGDGTCPGECVAGFQGNRCKQECDNGTYGSGCTEKCGFCFRNDVCDKKSGTCPDNCVAGYQGGLCNNQCNPGSYGQDCVETCGKCLDESPCIYTNGTCPGGCKAGYEGHTCKTECSDGRYGEGCVNICGNCKNGDVCNKMTGICETGCAPGYVEPECRDKCSNGFYGDGCLSRCGNCKPGTVCNHVNGSCEFGCSAGYMSKLCQQECDDGYHGEDCVEECGQCADGDPCNKFNGTCQGCATDYVGHDCKLYLKADDEDKSGTGISGGIIGGVAGSVVVAAVVVVVVGIFIRRRRRSTENTTDNFERKMKSITENMSIGQNDDKKENETSTEYYSTLDSINSTSDRVRISKLWDYIRQGKNDGNALFDKKFRDLSLGMRYSHDVASLQVNKSKNLHINICAYDHNRVPLVAEKERESEYINASFISGIGKSQKFIASQGPLKETRIDFLRMVWQQKIKAIVMLTAAVEVTRKKCVTYWDENQEARFGDIYLQHDSASLTSTSEIRQLRIRQNNERWRHVTVYHFKAWPDTGVPENTWSLVQFWRNVMDQVNKDLTPIVVHCSTGTGRTGTFIALDIAYNQAKSEGTVMVFDVVKTLREQRVNMVQTKEQYVFLHEALADALLIGTTSVSSRDFPEIHEFLIQTDPDTGKQRMLTQYMLISDSLEGDNKEEKTDEHEYSTIVDIEYQNLVPQFRSGHSYGNMSGTKQVENQQWRPQSAFVLTSFDGQKAFVVSKPPTKTSLHVFMSLIVDKQIKTVVILQEGQQAENEVNLGQMASFETSVFGLELLKETTCKTYCQQELLLKRGDKQVHFSQFKYIAWQSNQTRPNDTRSMLGFIEAVMDGQGRLSGNVPILVCCSSVGERGGLFCVLINELERMKRQNGQINIVESVKLMKERDGMVVPNFMTTKMKCLYCEQECANFANTIGHLLEHHPESEMKFIKHEDNKIKISVGERGGLFCVLINELERMKRQNGQINIVESVKLMKERDGMVVPNFMTTKMKCLYCEQECANFANTIGHLLEHHPESEMKFIKHEDNKIKM